jgi:hypothetical protein
MIADRKFAQYYSVTKDAELAALPPTRLTDYLQGEALKSWTLDHRYQVVGYSWLAMAAGTLLYQWKRKDIKTAQKLINARMASQLLALLGFAAVAGTSFDVLV